MSNTDNLYPVAKSTLPTVRFGEFFLPMATHFDHTIIKNKNIALFVEKSLKTQNNTHDAGIEHEVFECNN